MKRITMRCLNGGSRHVLPRDDHVPSFLLALAPAAVAVVPFRPLFVCLALVPAFGALLLFSSTSVRPLVAAASSWSPSLALSLLEERRGWLIICGL